MTRALPVIPEWRAPRFSTVRSLAWSNGEARRAIPRRVIAGHSAGQFEPDGTRFAPPRNHSDRWAERTLGPVYDMWGFAAWSAEEQRRPVQDEGEGGGAVRTPRHADDELLAVRGDVVVRSRVGVRARLEQRLRRPGLE